MSIRITIDGGKKVQEYLKNVARKLGDMPMKEAAFAVEREAKIALTVGPTRAIRTGRLRASTGVQQLGRYFASIYPTVNYAIYVHEGTRYMRARPFMEVAAKASTKIIEQIFGDHVRAVVKRTQ